ncbi:MAG: MetQ/NlpA family lipoprotein [Moraxella sp.]|nr:MetQ/NlpA family lipoprotein [Moraxella sp.]
MKFSQLFGLCALTSGIALVGCGGDKPTQTETKPAEAPNTQTAPEAKADTPTGEQKIKVGVMSGPEHKVAEVAAKVAKEKYGLVVEYVEFNDYAMPNTAVSKGDLDANAMQHKPYLDEDSAKKKLDNLAIVGNTFVYPLAGYSKTIKNVSELKDGAVVAVPNDPSNLARALILLEKQGLIKLKDNTNLLSTSLDIAENPKNLTIKEVDTAIAARALDDVDLAVVNNTYAGQVGLTANDGVFVEDKDSPYVNIIVSRTDNKDSDAIQNFVKAYQSDEVEAEAKAQFKDGVVKGW